MNKQQLQQEIAELQKQLEEKQKALSAMPDKWEPKGGGFTIDLDGMVEQFSRSSKCAEFGIEYATREQAEKSAKAMRAHNRLLAYVAEFAPDWDERWFDIEHIKCFVYYDNGQQKWYYARAFSDAYACTVYMPREVAVELCKKLNSGEVEL